MLVLGAGPQTWDPITSDFTTESKQSLLACSDVNTSKDVLELIILYMTIIK